MNAIRLRKSGFSTSIFEKVQSVILSIWSIATLRGLWLSVSIWRKGENYPKYCIEDLFFQSKTEFSHFCKQCLLMKSFSNQFLQGNELSNQKD